MRTIDAHYLQQNRFFQIVLEPSAVQGISVFSSRLVVNVVSVLTDLSEPGLQKFQEGPASKRPGRVSGVVSPFCPPHERCALVCDVFAFVCLPPIPPRC